MSLKILTFEASEESIATLDEIAENLGENREFVLREAVASYLSDYQQDCIELAEADRQIDAGETVPHDEVVAWFNAQHKHESEAA